MEPTQTTQLQLTETAETQKQAYEAPQIIYEGLITTRAGSPTGGGGDGGIDPTDLFGS